MRIVFAGTPKFAVKSLSVLNQSEHEVVAVYCQPDRPKGRGKVLTACPVKIFAEENNIAEKNSAIVKKINTLMKEAHQENKEWPLLKKERNY